MKLLLSIIGILLLISCDREINPDLLPVACFHTERDTLYWGEYFKFMNCSELDEEYIWSFGDNFYSHERNPLFRYPEAGTYQVKLIVANDEGVDSLKQLVYVLDDCRYDMTEYDWSYGIDYDHPELYLESGEQSDLDQKYVDTVIDAIGSPELTITYINKVCHWLNQNFDLENAGGTMIGQVDVNYLFETMTVYGCHSQALALSSVLRKLGFPALMIETASVQWAYDYVSYSNEGMAGHVMTELYLDDKWILYDNNCHFVEAYDVYNPFISTAEKDYYYNKKGLFAVAKGLDTWDYFEKFEGNTDTLLYNFALHLNCFEDLLGSVNYSWK